MFTPAENALRVARIVADKEAEMLRRGRCPKCWHTRTLRCICGKLQPLGATRPYKFMLYVHWKEFFSAGDDAKLLQAAAPRQTELYVHGRAGDDARFAESIEPALHRQSALLLFPDDSASSVEHFLDQRRTRRIELGAAEDAPDSHDDPIVIVVVDSTWTHARKMAHHLDVLLGGRLPHVKLDTDLVSSYARTQSQPGRVCTIEAIALLLQAAGEPQTVFDALVGYVKINNAALRSGKEDLWTKGPHCGHPVWYYGGKLRAEWEEHVPRDDRAAPWKSA
eukprot:CAMPEP_0206819496 /NCGR_PEP_ID=MMETSP0975-20121206/11339_1 /ASSEMBLY_ACC=CAM_ASM_000399 /TAXON_ID=483370 /ORGANISM="non described non described, Strain CCMP2097" /LENGTH=278 /DNA_ID=CAMNT_0054361723 /DNA_START=13 /DNA_END=845 /DNA_ORIENTATION=-